MKHIYIDNKFKKTLILLHGTGGDEHDLLEVAKFIDEEANILSLRGNIKENGMNRFFKRISVGVYDIENYLKETKNLLNSILAYSNHYNFSLENATIIGFSNGANIAIGLLQTNPIIKKYILFSPDFINPESPFKDLSEVSLFITNADNDPYVNKETMKVLLNRLGESVTLYPTTRHQITYDALMESRSWYRK